MIIGHQPAQDTSKTNCSQPGSPPGIHRSTWERWFSLGKKKKKSADQCVTSHSCWTKPKSCIYWHQVVRGSKMKFSKYKLNFFPGSSMTIRGNSRSKPPQWGSMLVVASKWDQGNGHENMSVFPAYSLTTGRRKLSLSCHLHEDGRLDNTGLCFLWDDLTPLQKTKRKGRRFSSDTGWDKAAEQLGRGGGSWQASVPAGGLASVQWRGSDV